MGYVVISYAREDEAAVGALHRAIERHGLTVWRDDGGLQPGDDFEGVIRARIEQAAATVVVWSRHSFPSRWVRDEATLAEDCGNYFPVRIDAHDLPLGLSSRHAADLQGWSGSADDPRLGRVVESLAKRVTQVDTTRAGAAALVLPPPRPVPPPAPLAEAPWPPTQPVAAAAVIPMPAVTTSRRRPLMGWIAVGLATLAGGIAVGRALSSGGDEGGPATTLAAAAAGDASAASTASAVAPTVDPAPTAAPSATQAPLATDAPPPTAISADCRVLEFEDSCPQVRELEDMLNQVGLHMAVTDDFGSQTIQSLRSFANIEGIAIDQDRPSIEYEGELWRRLVARRDSGGYPSIAVPNAGPEEVADLQKWLVRLGDFALEPGEEARDVTRGLFGPRTTAALKAWQERNGYTADSTVEIGSAEWMAIEAEAAAAPDVATSTSAPPATPVPATIP